MRLLNKKYVLIVLMLFVGSFLVGYFITPKNDYTEEIILGDTIYNSENYDKMRISYLNIKERKTGTASFNNESDMEGHDASATDNYIRTFDTMSYILEVGIERNENSTEETDNFYGGIIKLKISIPKDETGIPYLSIMPDAWMHIISKNSDLTEFLVYYAIPNEKSPVGGNQQLSVTMKANDKKHIISQEYMPKFEVWMEGNQPDDDYSLIESKTIQDEGPLYITGSTYAYLDLTTGSVNKKGTKNGVTGQYISFGARAYTYNSKGYITPVDTMSSTLTIEYYYKDIEVGDDWINIATLEDDPIYGTTLHAYGRPCETTNGFYPSSSSNSGYGYCATGSYVSTGTTSAYFYNYDSGTVSASQEGNKINFSNTDFTVSGSNTYMTFVSDGFEIFVPWYEPEEGGRYQYQVKIRSNGLQTMDIDGNPYTNSSSDVVTFTFYNYMTGNFNNNIYFGGYGVFTDTALLPLGEYTYLDSYVVGLDGPYLGGLEKLEVWNSSIVDFVHTSSSPSIYYSGGTDSHPTNSVMYYGIYKSDKQNGVTTDEEVNAALFDDFDWYTNYDTAASNGKVTAIRTNEPGWRGMGVYSYIYDVYLRPPEDETLIGKKGIVRQKIWIYADAERTEVFEIGTDTDYVSSIMKEDKSGLERQATPQGIGETYYIGSNMNISISNYVSKSSYNVEEEVASFYMYPSFSNPPSNLATSDFTIVVEIPKYLKYKANSSNYDPVEVSEEDSSGWTYVTWEFNDWDLTKDLPRIDYKLELSPYAQNNSNKSVYANIYCSDVVDDYYSSASFYIINLAGSSVRKTIDKQFLEIDEKTTINDYIFNIAQSRLTNVKTIEILPKDGDSVGSDFDGSYTLKLLSLADNQTLYYTNSSVDEIGMVEDSFGKKHIQPIDLASDDKWIEINVGDIIPNTATAIASYIPELSSMSDIIYKYEFIPIGNKARNKYFFKVTASSDNLENAISTEYKKISIADRKIAGRVFFDLNRNNYYDTNYWYSENYNNIYSQWSDPLLEGKTIKLYKADGEFVTSVTTDENGYYEISGLEKDDYYIEYDLEEKQMFISKGTYSTSSVINPDTGKSDIISKLKENAIDDDVIAENQNVGIKARDAQVIVHHYIEGTTESVHSDDIYNYFYDRPYSTSYYKTMNLDDDYKELYEYNEITAGDPIKGTVSKDLVEVTYYYQKRPAALKVQHFIKGTETKIVADVITHLNFGDSYETSRIDDLNYIPAGEDGDPTSGIITKENTKVMYYYEKKPATITVHHYIEGTTTKVHEDDILNRNYNERYTTNYYDSSELDDDYKDIYEYSSSTGRTSGTINEDSLEVIYYYTKKDAKLVVHHYALGTTFKVHENEIYDKKMNEPYETHHKESNELFDPDYVYDSVVGNETGTMDADRVEVNYYYKLKEGNIVVHHITDDTNEEMCPDETASGPYKTKYNYDSCTTLSNINYTFKEIISNDPNSKVENDRISGRINQDNTEITYYYMYKPGQIVVHYFLAGTRERVADDTIADGKINEEYTSSAKTLEGYKLVKEPEVKTITFKEDTQELIYEYERIKFKIEVVVVDGEGSITGAEEVFYGDNEKNNVIIKPSDNYEINSVIVNGKEMTTLNIEGMTLSKFEGIKENILVEVKFVEKTQDIPLTGKTRNILLYVGSILFILAFSIFVIYDHKKRDYNS